jgi:hypothetical protein
MTTNEAQQKVSRDQGLAPLLRYLSGALNTYVMPWIDDRYEIVFAGLDSKTEEQAIELRLKQSQSHYTVNEVREMDGLKPMKKGGDIILNPTYTGYIQQQAMQQPPGGGMPGMPGGGDDSADQGQGGADPYGSAFAKPPGDEENQARQVLQQKAIGKKGDGKSSSGNAGTGDDGRVSSSEERVLLRDNWESDIRSSLHPGDLVKSWKFGGVYDVIDLENTDTVGGAK